MNVILLIVPILLVIIAILWYLYYQSLQRYKSTNFTPFIVGRISPWTIPQEEALSNSKATLELMIQFLEHKLNASMTALVESIEWSTNATLIRWEMRMLRTLRTELTALKNKKLKEQ